MMIMQRILWKKYFPFFFSFYLLKPKAIISLCTYKWTNCKILLQFESAYTVLRPIRRIQNYILLIEFSENYFNCQHLYREIKIVLIIFHSKCKRYFISIYGEENRYFKENSWMSFVRKVLTSDKNEFGSYCEGGIFNLVRL